MLTNNEIQYFEDAKIVPERVVNLPEFLDTFECSICLHLIVDPVKLRPCDDHFFCRSCITDLLMIVPQDEYGVMLENLDVRNCPKCRTLFRREDVLGAGRFFNNILSHFEVKCMFEKNGCEYSGKLKELYRHEDLCSYMDGLQSRCESCNSWVDGKFKRDHSCVKRLNNRFKNFKQELLNCFRSLAEEKDKQLRCIDVLQHKIKNMGDRVENIFIRQRNVETYTKKHLNKRKRKIIATSSSSEEEYAPSNSNEVDFGKQCQYCHELFLRKDLYRHSRRCLNNQRWRNIDTMEPRAIEYSDEVTASSSWTQATLNSSLTQLVNEISPPVIVEPLPQFQVPSQLQTIVNDPSDEQLIINLSSSNED